MNGDFPYSDLLPFESHFAEIEGYKMHYIDEGEGDAVILVHGNPTWCFYFRELIGKLKDSFRVIAPDHIGCGLSEHPPARFRAKDRVRHLEALLDMLGLESYSFVMHDWGGPIGTSVALNNVDKVNRLVYLNTTLTETESLPTVIKLAARPIPGRFMTRHTKYFLKLATTPGLGITKKLPKKVRKGYFYPYRRRRDREAIWNFVDDIPFHPEHPSFSDMQAIGESISALGEKPVKIIWGLKDPCFHEEMLSKVVSLFPQADVTELPKASHLVLEDEGDKVCSLILDFLLSPSPQKALERAEDSSQKPSLYKIFVQTAEKNLYRDAVIIPRVWGNSITYRHINYKDMLDLVRRYHRGLISLGLERGDRVLFLVKPGIDFLALAYAVMAEGAVPVFIDPGIEKKHLYECLKRLDPDVFIGTQKAHILRLLKKGLFPSLKFHVIASEWSVIGGPTLSILKRFSSHPVPPTKYWETAMIGFTSGATGPPKGVVFTQDMVLRQLKIFREFFGIEERKRDLPLLPIFSLFHIANGVTAVFPPIDPSKPLSLDPHILCKIVSDLGISYSFGSPTLWKKIAQYCVRSRVRLPTLEKIFMAGAPVPQETVKILKEAAPNSESYTPYGATEALPVTLVSGSELLSKTGEPASSGELGVYVGKAVEGVEIKVIKPKDGIIDDISKISEMGSYEIGEVIVKGANVSRSYHKNPAANAASKISDTRGLPWHRMGDMGYLDREGGLYFCGRKSHVVRWNEKIFYPIPVERVFNCHPKINRTALVDGGMIGPVIVAEPTPGFWPEGDRDRERLIGELRELGQADPLTKDISLILLRQSLPVDSRHNAKIYRDRLRDWVKAEVESKRIAAHLTT
ncbi:MAG: alpha/beta fold hydrolase [Candidatus Dadabacteria bacterium]|nr:MAG: alpha/beta fold hydrolase [Candidatus Dadabacteria bacterium]